MRLRQIDDEALLSQALCCCGDGGDLCWRGVRGRHAGKKVTAQEVVDAIKTHVGVEWREKTVDTFKTGDPNTVVTGWR